MEKRHRWLKPSGVLLVQGLALVALFLGLGGHLPEVLPPGNAWGNATEEPALTANNPQHNKPLRIVATTPIVADLVRNVAPEATISTLIPPGADPHTFEPSLASLREIANADAAFSNQLLLEKQSLIAALDANLPPDAPHIALAEKSVAFGAYHIPLVEDAALATVWLGFRVEATEHTSTDVEIRATGLDGPGEMAAFTTDTFGRPKFWMASADGFDDSDKISLPPNSHTHMSWGFTKPGRYRLRLCASGAQQSQCTTLRFVVGQGYSEENGVQALDSGHADITAFLSPAAGKETIRLGLRAGGGTNYRDWELDKIQIVVPHATAVVLTDPKWSKLAAPGKTVWILAQAVLGQHVHGEIDPHLWHDVQNAMAYVETIAAELSRIRPEQARSFQANVEAYSRTLKKLDAYMREVISSIPQRQRVLVSAHDSFGYLAKAYGLKIGGFVVPNPGVDPSILQLTNLTRTLNTSPAPAVFIEPTSPKHLTDLQNAAQNSSKSLCTIYSDTLTDQVDTYVGLMVKNAKNLKACLDPTSLSAWDFPFVEANNQGGKS